MLSRRRPFRRLVQHVSKPSQGALAVLRKPASTSTEKRDTKTEQKPEDSASKDGKEPGKKPAKKTMAEVDEEMRRAMEGMAGDGGESGVELEDGKPVSMKRGVRENMFRYI